MSTTGAHRLSASATSVNSCCWPLGVPCGFLTGCTPWLSPHAVLYSQARPLAAALPFPLTGTGTPALLRRGSCSESVGAELSSEFWEWRGCGVSSSGSEEGAPVRP